MRRLRTFPAIDPHCLASWNRVNVITYSVSGIWPESSEPRIHCPARIQNPDSFRKVPLVPWRRPDV